MTNNNIVIKIGQMWASYDTEFVVNEIKEIDGQVWIFYNNSVNGTSYSCLEPAFRARFYAVVNKG